MACAILKPAARMTVLSVAYPMAPVGSDAVGGAEQILTALDAALVHAGHRSLVVASGDSHVSGELVPLPPINGPFESEAVHWIHEQCRGAIGRALQDQDIHVVHLHGVDFHTYLPPGNVTTLATLHLPVSWYPSHIFHSLRAGIFLHCVSETQHRDCPPCSYLLPPIHNGVETPRLSRSGRPQYALAIGRICPEKGFHLALDAASRAGTPLVLAGQVFPYEQHEKYFQNEVLPRLGAAHTYVGPVGRERKLELYANARCLIVSSTVPETSSLVALEALACGVPVVAFRVGALPEIVIDRKTGFLVDTVDEMARAILRAAEIDSEECRRIVRQRFSIHRMTARYLQVYEQICQAKTGASPGRLRMPNFTAP